MSESSGTIELLALELVKVLQPLRDDLSPERARMLFLELGIVLPQANVASLSNTLKATVDQTVELTNKSSALNAAVEADNTAEMLVKGLEVIGAAKNVWDSFAGLKNGLAAQGLPGVTGEIINNFPARLFNYLLARYLERMQGVVPALSFFGIVEQTEKNIGSLDPNTPPYTLTEFHFNKLADWLKDPARELANIYDWGKTSFDGTKLFPKLEDILSRQGIPVLYDDTAPTPLLDLVIVEATVDQTVNPKGVQFVFKNELNVDFTASGDDYDLTFKSAFNPPVATSLLIQPNANIRFTPPDATALSGNILFDLIVRKKTNPAPYIILGQAGGSRLEVTVFELKAAAKMVWGATAANGDFVIEGSAKGGKLIIDASGGDSFLSKLLPFKTIENEFDIAFGISSESGIYFKGSSTLEIRLPMHLAIGPVSLEGMTLSLGFKDGKFPITLGVDLKGELGPLTVVVENIGATASFAFPPNNSGNLGLLDMSIGFKPPNGLGLAINAGAVMGGGYLFFDFEKEEYAGAMELTIAGLISAKAIGLITTKMPDGSKGFSMLIIITVEFMPPFQLGYGFTLNGVGGLLGLNRTMLLDPLRNAVRTGAVNSIMFPQNVIANAPRIISDLKAIFPPHEGKFLIGPMAKMGWGTPSLITLSLGLIIEIPGNIAILGVLKIALPEERIPLVQIQVLFVGTIDFDKKMLTFDASLYESFILNMTLEGDMAVRLKWGDEPDFILSAGGFHPSYTPPPLALPALRRMAINILNTDVARIRIECYQAITSNTVQFGSKAELYFGFSAISVRGHIQFDALFQFSPFYFIIEITGSASLDIFSMGVFSIRLRFTLEGPTPWRAKGRGGISFFFFDVSANFDKTWGESKNTSVPDVAILPKFIEQINKREQWSTALSSAKNLLVSLRKLEEADAASLILHPAGSLMVQQKLLPLTVKFDKIGNQKTSDVQKITISKAVSAGVELTIDNVHENFALAQYQNFTDAEKLSRPSFEKLPGGVNISQGGINIKNGKMTRRKVEYEVSIIDKEAQPVKKPLLFGQLGILFNHFLSGNSVSKSPLSKSYSEKLQPFAEKTSMQQEGYTVAFAADNRPFGGTATFASEMMAQSFLQEQVARNPSLKKDLHIIPNYELQES